LRVGLADPSHFARDFRRYHGFSPSEGHRPPGIRYRNMAADGTAPRRAARRRSRDARQGGRRDARRKVVRKASMASR
jgi:AraC-like DNA-binding protein